MVKRAVMYARVSGNDRLRTGGENLQDQIRLCREYANKQGYLEIATLAEDDRGASGATFDLPELSKVLDMARSSQFDVLIVRELDRLSRDLAKQLIVEQELKRAGVTIEYVLYDFPDTPEGRLNKNLRAMLAEYEREKIAQRMSRGKRRRISSGYTLRHPRPLFGYQFVEIEGIATYTINEEEAQIIKDIFTWYTVGDYENGPMSGRAIARRLTELQVPTYNDRHPGAFKRVRNPCQWGQSSVAAILGKEDYCGVWHYGKGTEDPIAVEIPAIIDRDTWEAAQARKADNRENSPRNAKHQLLLRKRLYCASCGRKIQFYTVKPNDTVYAYYKCHSRKDARPCELTVDFRADQVDELAWKWVKKLLSDPAELELSLRRYQQERLTLNRPRIERLAVIDDLIAKNQAKLDRLIDLYLAGEFERETLMQHKASIQQEQDKLEVERVRQEAQVGSQEFSEDRLQSVLEFTRITAVGLRAAEMDFTKRRALIESLGVTGKLAIEDDQRILHIDCVIGHESLSFASKANLCQRNRIR